MRTVSAQIAVVILVLLVELNYLLSFEYKIPKYVSNKSQPKQINQFDHMDTFTFDEYYKLKQSNDNMLANRYMKEFFEDIANYKAKRGPTRPSIGLYKFLELMENEPCFNASNIVDMKRFIESKRLNRIDSIKDFTMLVEHAHTFVNINRTTECQ